MDNNFNTYVTGYHSATVSGTSQAITGLDIGTTYYYRVRSVNGIGVSPNSNVITLATMSKQNQTITFNSISAKNFGDAPFQLSATASSNLPVTYSSSNTTVATISGSTVTLVGVGSANITAAQAGNATNFAATDVVQALVVNKGANVVTFAALPAKTFGDATFSLTACAAVMLALPTPARVTVLPEIVATVVLELK